MSNCDQSCRRHRHHDRCDRHRRRRCNECRPFGIDCEVWDYIIVGAGAAGSVLAERLSADRRTSVLLLEAGQNSDHNPIIVAPNADVQQYFPQFFWQGRSLPEPLANNRTFQWTNGRLQGGGTSVYGMIYVRGTEERFDEWPAAGAGPTWNGPVVMQTYKEMERFNNNDAPPVSDPQNHGTQGRLQVRVGLSDSNSLPAFRRALTASNYPGTDRLIDDYNDPATPIGVFDNWQYYQFPDQTRGSSSRDYLGPDVIDAEGNGVNGRRLRVDTQTTAGRFIWSEREENTVIGVYAVRRSVPVQYLARRRVIVSAGIKSPQLLQINGIGPRPVLEAAGVEVRVDLPGVGRNVRNGPFILAALFIAPPGTTKNSQPGSFNVGGAFLPDPRDGADPNIRKLEVNGAVSDDIIPGLRVAYILLQPLRPSSTGFAEIQDADVNKVELADVGLLTTEDDLETLRLTFQRLIAPMSTSLQGEGYIQISPTPGTFDDPALLTEYIKNNVGNTHHYQCFNKMGPADQGGVVNEWGEVHGVRNLSVIDDSIAPLATDGNTGGTAMMLAYRIAKHLRGEI